MRDCYRRVEEADGYARKLERELRHAANIAEQSRLALAQCEDALAGSWAKLDEERLDFRAAQEALTFERERHKETTELLERVIEEARLSGDLADTLSRQVAILQSTPTSNGTKEGPNAKRQRVRAPLTETNLKLLDKTALVSQQSYESECAGFLPGGSD